MADRSILYRLRAALQGGYVAVANEVQSLATYVGVLSGVNNVETALQRFDGTGIGAAIFTFSGAYSAQNSNISEWFGGKQLVRMRCIDSGTGPSVSGVVRFDLPGATALNAAFDQLVTAGLPEQLTFVIEYTGPGDDFLQIFPRAAPSPQIGGTSSIIVRTGVAATIEVTRTGSAISDYTFVSIGGIGEGAVSPDTIKLINPTQAVWDASETGILPETGVVKGNAYRVVNAPSDGSGRFGEVMQNNDWVVWNGETFTTWTQTNNWFVIPAHEVRRITALEQDFLTGVQESPTSDRNAVIRGANYADSAGEIRLKMYATASAYSASDLNTTGDIDEYTEATSINGVLAVRLTGTQASLVDTLPNLYAYADDGNNNFTLLGNLARDFEFQGNFGQESDYLLSGVSYTANEHIRIYLGQLVDRFNLPTLDVDESNLTEDVQTKLNRQGSNPQELQDIATLQNKVAALYPLTPDVSKLTAFAGVFDDSQTVQEVEIVNGYSSIVDYRGDSTRYEESGITYDNTGTDVVRYTGLTDGFYRMYGFKVTSPADKTLLSLGSGATAIPLIDMTSTGNYRINNYHIETVSGTVVTNQFHSLTRVAGDEVLQTGEANVSTYQVTDYPTGSTERSRSVQIGLEVLVNGSDTGAEHLQNVNVPDENSAQARTTFDATIQLGPLHNNRSVSVTMSYLTRVDASGNMFIDVRLVTAPSDVTIALRDVDTILNYTAANTSNRVDNWRVLNDASGNYTFIGENELLLLLAPLSNGDANVMEAVPVARASDGTVDQLNNSNVAIPHVGLGSIEIPDGIDFRTALSDHYLRHSELASLVGRTNTQWCYGLALLSDVTDRQITELIDFTQGIALISPDGTRWLISVSNQGVLSASKL